MIVDDVVGLFPAELVGVRAAFPDQEPEGVARHTLVYGQAKLCIQVFETSARHSVRLSHWCAGAHLRGGLLSQACSCLMKRKWGSGFHYVRGKPNASRVGA